MNKSVTCMLCKTCQISSLIVAFFSGALFELSVLGLNFSYFISSWKCYFVPIFNSWLNTVEFSGVFIGFHIVPCIMNFIPMVII